MYRVYLLTSHVLRVLIGSTHHHAVLGSEGLRTSVSPICADIPTGEQVSRQVCGYGSSRTHSHTCAQEHIHKHVRTPTYTHARAHAHAHTHTHTHCSHCHSQIYTNTHSHVLCHAILHNRALTTPPLCMVPKRSCAHAPAPATIWNLLQLMYILNYISDSIL